MGGPASSEAQAESNNTMPIDGAFMIDLRVGVDGFEYTGVD
jgi:hypothetical protein